MGQIENRASSEGRTLLTYNNILGAVIFCLLLAAFSWVWSSYSEAAAWIFLVLGGILATATYESLSRKK